VYVSLDPKLALGPGVEGDPGFEVFHLEPVFDVDGDEKDIQKLHLLQ
jgi:hypothetical protein